MIQGKRAWPFLRNQPGRQTQRGISLLLALLFVAIFGGVLVTLARFNSGEVRFNEARFAGWELVEISKAARLYARDHFAADPSGFRNYASTPRLVPLSTLRAEGYLSSTFGRASGAAVSSLNQPIHVILTTWSVNGLSAGGDSVPATFVFFEKGTKSNPSLGIEIVKSARKFGASISAPLFDYSDNNLSDPCRGAGLSVSIWDTGCMGQSEFAILANAVGLNPTFRGGAIIMPSWKAQQPDLRAVLRYPQPDNPGFATMLTDLEMGTPVGDCSIASNQVQVTTTNAAGSLVSVPTDVCDVADDDVTANRRFNIDRVASVVAERVIAEAQTQDYVGGPTNIPADSSNIGTGNDDVMSVSGTATLGSDLRVHNIRPMPAGAAARLSIPNGTLVAERNSYLYSQNNARSGVASINNVTRANALITDNANATNFDSLANGTTTGGPQVNVADYTGISGNTQVIGAANAEFITETMYAPAAYVTASDATGQVQVNNTLSMNGSNMWVMGTAPTSAYAVLAGQVTNANTVTVSDDMRFLSPTGSLTTTITNYYDTTSPINTIQTTGRCLENNNVAGGCPERQYFPPSIVP